MALQFLNDGYFAGKVGIGTESPGAKLEIKDGNLWLNGATSNYNPEIFFIDDAGPTGIAGAKIRYENNNGNLYFDHKWDTATSGFFFRNRVDGTALNTMSLVNGKVGIDIDTPQAPLSFANVAGNKIDFYYNTTTSDRYGIQVQASELRIHSGAAGDSTGGITFGKDNGTTFTEAMRIRNDGKVGIGTDTPGTILDVSYGVSASQTAQINLNGANGAAAELVMRAGGDDNGTIYNRRAAIRYYSNEISTTTAQWVNGVSMSQTTGDDKFYFNNSGNSTVLCLQQNGNVGIGTTGPTRKLSVEDSSSSIIADFKYSAAAYSSIDLSNNTSFARLSSVNSDLLLSPAGLEKMRITSAGNVGIGTTSPDLKLDVTHATSGEYVATFQNTAANLELKLGVTSTNYLNIQGQEIGNSNAYNMSLQADGGNVGINTTIPTQKLHVAGNARVTGAYYDSNNSPGTANQVLVSTATGTDWVDGSAIPGVPAGSGTLNTVAMWTPDGDTLGDSRFTQTSTSNQAKAPAGSGTKSFEALDSSGNSDFHVLGTGEVIIPSNYLFVSASQGAYFTGNLRARGGISNDLGTLQLLDNTNVTGDLTVVGDIITGAALLSNQENTDVDTGTETVASVAIATYTAAFFDFVIKKTTNVRSGTVYACHDGTNVEFTETSTQDLGDTSDVTLSVDISGGNMRLRATTTSDDWSVKSLIRAI